VAAAERAGRAAAALLLALLTCLAGAAPASADVVDDNLAAVARAPGDVVLFARGPEGDVLVREGLDSGTWTSIGGEATSGPAAMVRPDGTLDVFVRGTDDAVHHASKPKGGDWAQWQSLGGVASSGPGATNRLGTDIISMLVIGADRALYHKSWNPRDGWSDYESLGPQVVAAPSPVSRRFNWLDVYVRGSDNVIYNKSFANSAWTAYDNVGGATLSAPSAITRANGNLDVFVRGTDRALHQRYYLEGQGYSSWFQVDPRSMTSGPAAVADGPSRVHVAARDGDDVIVKSWDASKGWASWRSIGPARVPAAQAPGGSGSGSGSAPPPPPAPAPVGGGQVSFTAGLSCTPRGGRMPVDVKVRKRPGRPKPDVRRVTFYYRKGGRKVSRTDRKAPYKRKLPIDLSSGTHRVFATIYYTRSKGTRKGTKTVSRRFAVCK